MKSLSSSTKNKIRNSLSASSDLQSERLNLFQLSPDTITDTEELSKLFSNPSIHKFQNESTFLLEKNLNSELEKKEHVNQSEDQHEKLWAVQETKRGKSLGLIQIIHLNKREAEIGFIIFPEYWRQGIAKEAGLLILRYLFNQSAFEKTLAYTNAYNEPCIKLLESLRFDWVGSYEEEVVCNEMSRRSYLYELDRKKWKKIRVSLKNSNSVKSP